MSYVLNEVAALHCNHSSLTLPVVPSYSACHDPWAAYVLHLTAPPSSLMCTRPWSLQKPWRRPVGRTLPSYRSCPLSCLSLFMCRLQLQVTEIQPLTGYVSLYSIGGWAPTASGCWQHHACPGRRASVATVSLQIHGTSKPGYLGDTPDPGLDPKSTGRMEAPAHHDVA